MPAVAVVIPLYNHEKYIETALDSVRAQTLPVERIVIVDDGSTDGSVARVKATDDPRIHLIQQANAGAHAAINVAVDAADSCEFVSILNSDDAYLPDRVERCAEFLSRNDHLDVVCTRLHLIDEQGTRVPADDPRVRRLERLWHVTDPKARTAAALGHANFVKTTSNLFGRRDIFVRHPFKPYRYVHDYAFAARAALEQRLGVLDDPLLLYRTHATNTIKAGPAGDLQREVLQMHFDLLRDIALDLQTSSEVRRASRDYFQSAFGNHSDFRAEPFLALLARLVAEIPPDELASRLSAIGPEAFPELTAASDSGIKEIAAASELAEISRTLLESRWFALGRALGVISTPAASPPQLAPWKKALQKSRWLKLGRAFGFYSDPLEKHSS